MKKLFCLLFVCFSILSAETMKIGTWNIRAQNAEDNHKGNGYLQRLPKIINMVKFFDYDIIGFQEDYIVQMEILIRGLDEYNHFGIANKDLDKQGTFNSIFFKKEKFSLIDKGIFWFAENDTYPNLGWDAKYIHSCTWVHLQTVSNQHDLFIFNLHGDYASKTAQKETSKLLIKKEESINPNKYPAIFLGDFNLNQSNEAYHIIQNSKMTDAARIASIKMIENGSFNNFNIDKYDSLKIDHVFVSPGIRVSRYGILTESYWHKSIRLQPSDHYPIMTEIELADP